nr:type II toxin-antitoxin system mRNA interferase toxin, RelE/StbE family [Bifidobacterium vespertilionis]
MVNNWKGYREIHIEGDWLLIYRIERNELQLVLTRTGSHDQLY